MLSGVSEISARGLWALTLTTTAGYPTSFLDPVRSTRGSLFSSADRDVQSRAETSLSLWLPRLLPVLLIPVRRRDIPRAPLCIWIFSCKHPDTNLLGVNSQLLLPTRLSSIPVHQRTVPYVPQSICTVRPRHLESSLLDFNLQLLHFSICFNLIHHNWWMDTRRTHGHKIFLNIPGIMLEKRPTRFQLSLLMSLLTPGQRQGTWVRKML